MWVKIVLSLWCVSEDRSLREEDEGRKTEQAWCVSYIPYLIAFPFELIMMLVGLSRLPKTEFCL